MSGRASAARYARALLDVAVREADPDQVGRDLTVFADLMAGTPELRAALTSPRVPTTGKQKVTAELVSRLGLTGPAAKLLLMLAERDRLSLVPDLVDVYRERLEEHQGTIRAEITAATDISSDHAAQLQQRLSAATGRKVTMTTKVDPALVGGMVARIGSTVYDGSVATQLEKLRAKLLQET